MSKELLTWYDQVMRPLPWRENKDPYRVWISEIMLQQTQVVTVISYFKCFITKYPDVGSLAGADESEVFKLWEGLGYYSRARNLIRCAKVITQDYDGIFPTDSKALEKLPGIGPYTAGAIASIAFDEKTPAVDGNVLRVVSRLHCIDLPIDKPKSMNIFRHHVMGMMTDRPGDFNQALMELGATICTPKAWKCERCPLSASCCAHKLGTVSLYPNKPRKTEKRMVTPIVLVLSVGEDIMLIKHPDEGLLGNLWGFPRIDVDQSQYEAEQGFDGEQLARRWLLEQLDIDLPIKTIRKGVPHIFTHIKWMPILYFFESKQKISVDYPIVDWVNVHELNEKALPTAFHKQMKIIVEEVRK